MTKEIFLPPPHLDGSVSLEAAIAARRSDRSYAATELTLEEIGQLLWAAQGVTGDAVNFRAAPSAGGCCPLEFYACRADGIWHYDSHNHSLSLFRDQDVRDPLMQMAWSQQFIVEAPMVFVVSAVSERTTSRYGDRGKNRYIPMDAGHAAQNLLLQAVALGLASVSVGAFNDDGIAEVMDFPTDQIPLYLLPVGHPAT